ncbi:Methyl-CpG-binding domain-containing protein 11 [Hordeum vulgare]|nr:Methyl-CpG-binding domain-containing protein 11 [Hordeum vulgare]
MLTSCTKVRLAQIDSSYYAWKTYFSLVFREYNLLDHVDGSVDSSLVPVHDQWSTIDATLIRWFFLTMSRDLFHTVRHDGHDAHAVWTKLNDLFTHSRLEHHVFLQQEFFGCHQDNSSIDDYYFRLKTLVDELRDIGTKIDDDTLLNMLIAGLSKDFGHATANLSLINEPSFAKFVAYLWLEEHQMKQVKSQAMHTALTAVTTRGEPLAPPTAPQQQHGHVPYQ